MSIWDSTPSWAQGEPVQNETENMQTGTENVEQTEQETAPEPVEQPVAETVEQPEEASEETGDESETMGRKNGKRTLPRQTEQSVTRLYRIFQTLQKDGMVKAVQNITGSRSEKPETLALALTGKKNREKVRDIVKTFDSLNGLDQMSQVAELTVLFSRDGRTASSLYRVLNLLHPDRQFGSASGVASKDAVWLASKLDEGVDLSVLNGLLYE